MSAAIRGIGKWLAIVGIAFALVIAGTAVGRTFAQDTNATPEQSATDPTTSTTKLDPAFEHGFGERGFGHGGRGGRHQRGVGIHALLVDETAQQTSQNVEDVVQALRDGASLSSIATEKGVQEQAIIDAAIQRLDERLTEAVTNGRIDEAQKTEMLAKATEKAPELMQQTGAPFHGGKGGRNHRQPLVEATAEVTGLTVDEVRAEVESGKSLAQVAEAHGKTAADILANLRTKGETKLDELLERAETEINRVPEK